LFKYVKAILIVLIFNAVLFTGCKKNKAPDKPSTPAGPTSGTINTEYTFTSSAEDPDDDSVAIRFDWGDGDTSDWSDWQASGDSISMTHSWSDSGSYTIRAQAQDLNEAVSSWSSSHKITIGATIANDPPNTPTTPIGDTIGSINVSYSFISTATDPDDDSVAIRFDWGDGDTSSWSDWQASGDSISMSYSWSDTGTYNIKAQAKDKKDTTSGWSAGHPIKISGGGWIKTLGGSDNDDGISVDVTLDGGYIIAGYTNSFGAGGNDVYLIKTDVNGDTILTKTFGGSSDDYGWSVQTTTDGGYIIGGHTRSYGAGYDDVYLVKTDANGDTNWTKTFGDTGNNYGGSVQQTSDGGYIIIGSTEASGPVGNYDVYLIKTDANGNQQWSKTYGNSAWDAGSSVQQTTDGGYIITGSTNSFGAGSYDVYLIKTDANGNQTWFKTFGGSGEDRGSSGQQTLDGGYIITGFTKSYGAGNSDVYLIKTDANGEHIWSVTFGEINDDVGSSVQQTTDGGYIITGWINNGANDYDVYLVKTDANGDKLWEKRFGGSSNDGANSIKRHYENYIITGHTNYGTGNSDVYLIKTDANGNVK
jgi:hypothetical protein